jgi:proteic killer suppression protein
MNDESALERIPHWRVHRLTGDLSGYWSLSVTRNWRLIFQVEDASIVNLDLVDYH